MENNDTTGIWVDHARALIVHLQNGQAEVKEVDSELDRKHRSTGGLRAPQAYSQRTTLSSRKSTARRASDIQHYFQAINKATRDSRHFAILGPGKLKHALKEYFLAHGHTEDQFDHLETTSSRLTDPEIIALFRQRFGQSPARFGAKQPQ